MSNAETEVQRLLKDLLNSDQRIRRFRDHVFSVGGIVRDEILGITSKDLDLVLDIEGAAEEFSGLLVKTFGNKNISFPRKMGESYPIWQVTFSGTLWFDNKQYDVDGAIVEITETQTEFFPDENSRQRVIKFGTLEEDQIRRDFTCNGLYKNITTGEIVDPSGVGISDIKNGILRCNPKTNSSSVFSSDPLRMLRCVRFHSRFGWSVSEEMKQLVKENANRINIISSERVHDELVKIMKMGKLAEALEFMDEIGLLKEILPEVVKYKTTPQSPNYHSESPFVWGHIMLVLKNSPPTVIGQLSALLHDIAKPLTVQEDGESFHYYFHEVKGVPIAEKIMKRLKFDSETIETVLYCVGNHMCPFNLAKTTDKALRRFMRENTEKNIDHLIELSQADEDGSLGEKISRGRAKELKERLVTIKNAPVPVVKKPALDGNEVMELLQIKPGPAIKKVHEFLLDVGDDFACEGKVLSKEEAKELVLKNWMQFIG